MHKLNSMDVEYIDSREFPTPMIVGKIDDLSSCLMALKLPQVYWDKSAWWTDNGSSIEH